MLRKTLAVAAAVGFASAIELAAETMVYTLNSPEFMDPTDQVLTEVGKRKCSNLPSVSQFDCDLIAV